MIVSRRGALDLGLIAVTAVTLPAAAMPDRTARPQVGDVLVAVDDRGHSPLRSEILQPGAAPVVAWPMDAASGAVRDQARYNQVLVLRLADEAAEGPTDAVVAFSAICPHAGCLVSEWVAQSCRLRCPCHGSEYDPAKGGAVVSGPAPQPLPTLPIRVVNGVIAVAGPFSSRPGGHTSRTM
jgi:rieske iron-sulfur protein